MATPVEAPKLGNTVEEVLIARWRKAKGDPVAAGEVIAEIETDKATFELTATADGVLLERFFEDGALVPVYTNLCVIGAPGEAVEPFRPASVERAPEWGGPPGLPSETQAAKPAPADASTPHGALSPRARRFSEERDFHPAELRGSGPGGRVLEEDLRELYFTSPRISDLARKKIRDGQVGDLPHEGVPLSRIRQTIARRMRESLASTAQYTLHASADAAGLLALRKRFKASATPEVTIGDMVAFCAVQTLLEFPDLNAELIEGRIHRHSEVHLGFACDTPRGLIVPVVENAHELTLAELSLAMKRLAAACAAESEVRPTFTVSNLGGLGIESFTPVLNPPQVAILGVDAIQVKPVRREGNVVFIDSVGLSLTCDHQAIDGAPGARFLQALKGKIENVESLCTI